MPKKLIHNTFKATRSAIWFIIIAIVVIALAIQFRIHLSNEWQQHIPLPPAFVPGSRDRVLVFAPHSDDETLGCGGLIAEAVENGADARVVLVTNGDGFRIAVGREFKTLRVTPKKCIEFAYKRQRETLGALTVLGVPRNHVTFLGYPDRGIAQLWTQCWNPDTLFVSHATHWDHSPYCNSFTRHAPYCGESILSDIEKIIKKNKPTDVYVPHPCDNHPDHYATYCFVMAAIEQLRSEDDMLAKKIKLHTYIVHRGDWPCPKGYHPNVPLAPPYGLARSDTKWYSLALSKETADLKRKAIRKYKTQTAVERGFMMSFARNNEIIGDLPNRNIAIVKPNTIHIDGSLDDWLRIPPVVVDPVDDYVIAGINRGGDVRAIYLCSDGINLYARIDCARHLSKRINYNINIRGLNLHDTNDCYSVSVKPGHVSSDTVWAWNGNVLEISIPLKKLNFDQEIFVQVQTKMMKLTVDNTGWHGIDFDQQRIAEGKKPKA